MMCERRKGERDGEMYTIRTRTERESVCVCVYVCVAGMRRVRKQREGAKVMCVLLCQ